MHKFSWKFVIFYIIVHDIHKISDFPFSNFRGNLYKYTSWHDVYMHACSIACMYARIQYSIQYSMLQAMQDLRKLQYTMCMLQACSTACSMLYCYTVCYTVCVHRFILYACMHAILYAASSTLATVYYWHAASYARHIQYRCCVHNYISQSWSGTREHSFTT